MRKLLVGGALLALIAGIAYLATSAQNLLNDKQSTTKVVAKDTRATEVSPRDPKTHDFSDVDYAQKKLIHHQLAALIADKAKTDATQPEIRQVAQDVSAQETERANAYAALLTSWGETYLNITDFPETGGCYGYPTFSGMLPHVDVASYRLSSGENVDAKFFSLIIEHHKKAAELVKLEGAKIGFGKLVELRNSSQNEYRTEIYKFEALQKSLL